MFIMELELWEVLFLKAGATYLYVGAFPDAWLIYKCHCAVCLSALPLTAWQVVTLGMNNT
jgi:hypothetical protein